MNFDEADRLSGMERCIALEKVLRRALNGKTDLFTKEIWDQFEGGRPSRLAMISIGNIMRILGYRTYRTTMRGKQETGWRLIYGYKPPAII